MTPPRKLNDLLPRRRADFAHTTCRLQRRSLHAYLIDLLSAHARGDPAPLLT